MASNHQRASQNTESDTVPEAPDSDLFGALEGGRHGRLPGENIQRLLETLAMTDNVRSLAADLLQDSDAQEIHILCQGEWHVVQMILWRPGEAGVWHDHGQSVGAVTVLEGVLSEDVLTGGQVAGTLYNAGEWVSFGSPHIHQMSNPSPLPAVSLHLYLGPGGGLPRMNVYQQHPTGQILLNDQGQPIIAHAWERQDAQPEVKD